MRKGFKVCQRRRYSENTFSPATKYIANQWFTYELHKTTKRNPELQGPIAVFSRFSSAAQFAGYVGAIFEVEYEPSLENKLWKIVSPGEARRNDSLDNIRYNEEINQFIHTTFLEDLPGDTCFAESVLLTKLVWENGWFPADLS